MPALRLLGLASAAPARAAGVQCGTIVDTPGTTIVGTARHSLPLVVLLAVAAAASPAQAHAWSAGRADVRASVRRALPVTTTTSDQERAQNSPAIAVDPTDPRYVVLASRVDGPDFDCALHVSGDRGRTWLPAMPVPKLPEGADRCYAPEVAFDRHGVLYYVFTGLHGAGNTPMGVFLTTSTDRRAFSAPRQVLGADRFMVRLAVDQTGGRHGRMHVIWVEAGAPPPTGGFALVRNPILAAYSDDGGTTFSEPTQVAESSRALVAAPAVAIGRGGALHVAYYDLEDDRRDYQGLEGPPWDGHWSLLVSTSSDGGRSFSQHAVAVTGIVPAERVMLIYTMPPPSIVADTEGAVWVAWPDARDGDSDVYVARSADDGRSFGPPLRVNDDPQGMGTTQYLPRLSVAGGGRLDAVFYDRRDDPSNDNNDVWYAFSSDGGRTFAANVRVTTESSYAKTGPRYPVPSAKGLVEFGSRLALAPTNHGVIAAWTDTRNVRFENTHQDIFATQIVVDGPDPGGPSRPWWVRVVGAIGVGAVLAVGFGRVRKRRRPAPGHSGAQ